MPPDPLPPTVFKDRRGPPKVCQACGGLIVGGLVIKIEVGRLGSAVKHYRVDDATVDWFHYACRDNVAIASVPASLAVAL